MSAPPSSPLDPMEVDNEQPSKYAKPQHRPTITSGECRDQIAEAMLAFRLNDRTTMIRILTDLDRLHVLKPVYEAQVCYLLMKYAVKRSRDQELDWAEKMKIACNNIIYKEKLVTGSNAWQFFHDLEVEADDYLKRWDARQKEIDAQEALDQDVHNPNKHDVMTGEGAAARRASVELKARQRTHERIRKVQESQQNFFLTYEGSDKEDLRHLDDESIKEYLQPVIESEEEELTDFEGSEDDEHGTKPEIPDGSKDCSESEEECSEEDEHGMEPEIPDENKDCGESEDDYEQAMIDVEKRKMKNQLRGFLEDDNLLPFFRKFIRTLGRKQALHQLSTPERTEKVSHSGNADEDSNIDDGDIDAGQSDDDEDESFEQTKKSNIRLKRLGKADWELVDISNPEDHAEEVAKEDAEDGDDQDPDGVDAGRGKKRKYSTDVEDTEETVDEYEVGKEFVLAQRPKSAWLDDGL